MHIYIKWTIHILYHYFPRLTLFIIGFFFFCFWIRTSSSFFHAFCILLNNTFNSRDFLNSLLLRFVTLFILFFFFFYFCLFMYALCSFSWNPLETTFYGTQIKKKYDWKRNINLTTSTDWTKLKCWLNYFKQRNNVHSFFSVYGLSNWQKWSIFFTIFGFELLNFMFESTI